MARSPRVFIPGASVHVIHRGNNRTVIFEDDEDCETYLLMVRSFTAAADVDVHAYALMKTHDHLLVTPANAQSLPTAMRRLGVTYVQYFNRKHGRIGTLFNERYKSRTVLDERYWLTCARYIDQNPIRAGLVARPEDYPWSSYRAHGGFDRHEWLSWHPVLAALGKDESQRHTAYRAMCGTPLTEAELVAQRRGTDRGRGQVRPGSVPSRDSSSRVASGNAVGLPAS